MEGERLRENRRKQETKKATGTQPYWFSFHIFIPETIALKLRPNRSLLSLLL